jgi:hypothetical protein
MALKILEKSIDEAMATASSHAQNCFKLIDQGNLAGAIEYCTREGIDPPQCSLTAQSDNANKLRKEAVRKLSDQKWWEKSLKTKAIRGHEADQVISVDGFISEDLADYTQKHKK